MCVTRQGAVIASSSQPQKLNFIGGSQGAIWGWCLRSDTSLTSPLWMMLTTNRGTSINFKTMLLTAHKQTQYPHHENMYSVVCLGQCAMCLVLTNSDAPPSDICLYICEYRFRGKYSVSFSAFSVVYTYTYDFV